MTIATTILAQLGGNRFLAMTGAKTLVGGEDFLQFDIPARSSRNKANKVRVTLTERDDYRVEFYRFNARSLECPVVDSVEGVYAENLRAAFTARTGLETSL